MQVFEDQHERRAASGDLEEASPRRQQRRAVQHLRLAGTDGGSQQFDGAVHRLQSGSFEPGADRVPHGRGIRIVGHADQAIEHTAQRPVGQPLAIGQALGNGHHGPRLDGGQALEELFEQPSLANACRGDDADQERSLFLQGSVRDQLELLQVGVAADERGARGDPAGRGATEQWQRPNGLRLAANLNHRSRTELEGGSRAGDGAFTADDAPWFGRRL